MNCVNPPCGKPIVGNDGDFTFKVLLCGECSTKLKKIRDRAKSELEVTLVTLEDALRFSVTSDLQFSGTIDELTTREQVLEFVVELDKQCRNTSKMTTSSKSTKLSATTVGGSRSSTKQ